jgi:hypothetical protein
MFLQNGGIYQTTWRHFPDLNLNILLREDLKSEMYNIHKATNEPSSTNQVKVTSKVNHWLKYNQINQMEPAK